MINEESRKYFNRAYASSSSAFSAYALHRANHVQKVQECFHIEQMDKLLEHLKVANSSALVKCSSFGPTVENPRTAGAFLTRTPNEVYNSKRAPVMDAMFSFNSQVHFIMLLLTILRLPKMK